MTSASKGSNRKVISPAECGQIHPRERSTRIGSTYVEACIRKVGRKVITSRSGDSETTIRRRKEELVNDPEIGREKKEHGEQLAGRGLYKNRGAERKLRRKRWSPQTCLRQ
jgi:hypothetical protein